MSLLIQLVTAIKEPTPPAVAPVAPTNLVSAALHGIPSATPYVTRADIIRWWAKSGHLCEVLGHRWESGRLGEGPTLLFLDYHPGTSFRHCSLCGVGQTKTEGDWK